MNFKIIILALTILTLTNCTSKKQQSNSTVKVVGEMKNVMWKGQLYGTIDLDTIANKNNLYGLGPIENLAGEIMIIEGKSYKSTVLSDTSMIVKETYHMKAPFFAYANITNWTEQTLPDSIQSAIQIEQYLDNITASHARPFLFKFVGTVEQATIHIVNLPKGSIVSSPDEAHAGQVNYELENEPAEIIGFFSTMHKAIFTHHNTFLHMHLITSDRKKMGHLDQLRLKKGTMKLYLPTK
jgi:acetolactate decarboxylase